MQRSLIGLVVAALVAFTPLALEAQTRSGGAGAGRSTGTGSADSVPAAYKPPPGMCRVWISGVQPARQPAPTTCPVAIKNMQPNARLLYGPDPDAKKTTGTMKVSGPPKAEPPGKAQSKTLPPKTIPPPRRDTLPNR